MTDSLMRPLVALVSLLIAVAGWFYLFYSRAAHRLSGVENIAVNDRRIRLRRIGGFAMLLLAGCFYSGFFAVDAERPMAFVVIWSAVFLLLGLVVLLGFLDLRMTVKLRNDQSTRGPK